MHTFKFLAAIVIGGPASAKCAVCADEAKEAYDNGMSSLARTTTMLRHRFH